MCSRVRETHLGSIGSFTHLPSGRWLLGSLKGWQSKGQAEVKVQVAAMGDMPNGDQGKWTLRGQVLWSWGEDLGTSRPLKIRYDPWIDFRDLQKAMGFWRFLAWAPVNCPPVFCEVGEITHLRLAEHAKKNMPGRHSAESKVSFLCN